MRNDIDYIRTPPPGLGSANNYQSIVPKVAYANYNKAPYLLPPSLPPSLAAGDIDDKISVFGTDRGKAVKSGK